MDDAKLAALRERFSCAGESIVHSAHFAGIAIAIAIVRGDVVEVAPQ